MRELIHAIEHMVLGWRLRLPSESQVLKRARADAGAGSLFISENALNASQQVVVNQTEEAIAGIRQHLKNELRQCDEKLQRPDVSFNGLDIAKHVATARHTLSTFRSEGAVARQATREHIATAKEELKQFRKTNRLLHRCARYQEHPLLAYGLLAMLFLLEVFFSGDLLSEYDAQGLLGGWWSALLISAINILPALATGIYAMRGLHHIDVWRRRWASVGLVVGVGWLLILNSYVAHYRYALGVDADTAATTAGASMLADPLGFISDTDAFFLFGLGLFTAFVALIEGYCVLDDPHVGYGAIDRAHRRQERALGDMQKRQVAEVKQTVRRAEHDVERALKRLDRRAKTASALVGVAMACLQYCERQIAQLVRTCGERIGAYREEYQRVSTAPQPAFLTAPISLDVTLACDSAALHEKRADIRRTVAEKRHEAHQALEALRAEAEADIAAILDVAPARTLALREGSA